MRAGRDRNEDERDSRKNSLARGGPSEFLPEKRRGGARAPRLGRLKREDTMNGYRRWTGAVGIAIVIGLGGCATAGHGPVATERVLSAAGFQMKLADTPETLATLHSLPPRTLVPEPRDGQMRYVYADPRGCGCLYVGTEGQYQEYQRLEFEKQLADERLSAAWEYRNATMGWGGQWGPWPW